MPLAALIIQILRYFSTFDNSIFNQPSGLKYDYHISLLKNTLSFFYEISIDKVEALSLKNIHVAGLCKFVLLERLAQLQIISQSLTVFTDQSYWS